MWGGGGCVDGGAGAGYNGNMVEDESNEAKAITAGKAPALNRQIKDSVFSDLFASKQNLLALYRALHPEDTAATEGDIANVTMKNILMVDLYNDLGFTVRDKLLLLVEAQSTWTVNVAVRLLLYLAETWGEYIKVTGQNIYGTKKLTLPLTECYVVFTGDRKDKPSVISLFDEFHPCAEGMLELKVRVIFRDEVCESLDILQQYIAFSRELDAQFKKKGRTIEALTVAIEKCKSRGILREYLRTREKEVVKIMTMLFDQGYVNEIACKESETKGVFKTLYELVKDNLLSMANAAKKAGQSEKEFAAGMNEYFAQLPVAKQ